jgi:Endonuclease/Exonuclease/phosphatase family
MSSFLALHIAKARRSRWRVIIGGDFNSRPEDEDLDSDNQTAARRRDNALHNFLNRQGLVNAWVCANPDDPGYTHHTPSLNTVSRIDYVYCSHNFRDSIRSVILLVTSNLTFDHNFIKVNTCAKPSFNKDLCKEQATAKKNATKRVFCSSNVVEEAWINYRGIIHSRLQI